MGKYLKLLALWVICLLGAVLVSYFMDNNIKHSNLSLNTLSEITSVATSLATFIIALVLYKRFNGSQAIVDEQTKRTIELIRYISDIRIDIEHIETKEFKGLLANITIFDFRLRDKEDHPLLDKEGNKLGQYVDQSVMSLLYGLGDF